MPRIEVTGGREHPVFLRFGSLPPTTEAPDRQPAPSQNSSWTSPHAPVLRV
jgi:hypothetical protein